MNSDEELAALLKGPAVTQQENSDDRIARGLGRTRVSLGQQQTLSFVLVNFWATLAKTLAPIFAIIAKRHAEHAAEHIKLSQKEDFK